MSVVPLTVPPPSLVFKPLAGVFAPLEDVVGISFPAVRFPDGSPMTSDDFAAAQALLTRVATASSGVDVWDAAQKIWRAAASLDLASVRGLALMPPPPGAQLWTGVLVGAGQQDAAGAPLLAAALGGFPQYRVRGLFRAKRDAIEAAGLGPDSAPLQFLSAEASKRFAATLTPDADSATRVQIALRNAGAEAVGLLDIDASGGNAVITLRNFDASGNPLAAVMLQDDGSIRLQPAAGRRVIVAGDLEAERITYLPSAGLPKKTLN